jgi:hypothetical protein
MRRTLELAGFALTALGVIIVAVSNRHQVPFYFWPGGQGVEMRLFALLLFTGFGAYVAGRLAGVLAARRLKSQLRQAQQVVRNTERDRQAIQQELEALKAATAAQQGTTAGAAVPVVVQGGSAGGGASQQDMA